jgi:small GTP-binding protein
MINFGLSLERGFGVEVNHSEAAEWYRRAIAGGNHDGIFYLFTLRRFLRDERDISGRDFHCQVQRGVDGGSELCRVVLGEMSQFGLDPLAKNGREAFGCYRLASEHGNEVGILKVGICYELGVGVEADCVFSTQCYRQFADCGNSEAQWRYALALERGIGTAKNFEMCLHYYELSSEQGDSEGQVRYGMALLQHPDAGTNPELKTKSAQLFKASAERLNPGGQLQYGISLETGRGVPKDESESVRYYKLSADRGNPEGQRRYGICRRDGKGIVAHQEDAMKYLRLAALQGDSEALYTVPSLIDFSIKIAMAGESSVGKTWLFSRYVNGAEPGHVLSTMGNATGHKNVSVEGRIVQCFFWDTAGQEAYRSISALGFRDADGILLVYDITKRDTFDLLTDWIQTVSKHIRPDALILIVGNKCDLVSDRVVSEAEAVAFAEALHLRYFETSALNGQRVQMAFNSLVTHIVQQRVQRPVDWELPEPVDLAAKPAGSSDDGSCC